VTGVDTSKLPGVTPDTHPAEIEAVNAPIAAGYATDPRFRDHLTEAQAAAIVNF
jgi:hypothetical protein